jgi:hypothetical protein
MASNPRKKKIDNPGGETHTKANGTEIPMIAMKVFRYKKPSGMYWVAIDGGDLHMRPVR